MNWKKYYKRHSDTIIGAAVLGIVYLAQAALRPLSAPEEYDFIVELQKLFPAYPDNRFLLRLPAIAATFVCGAMMMRLSCIFKFKRPGMTAAYYLLFPMVFYAGTSASGAPLMIAGILMALWGMIKAAATEKLSKRAVAVFTALPGVIVAAAYAQSGFCCRDDFYLLIPPVLVLLCAALLNRMEMMDKERARRFLNRMIYCCTGIAAALGIVILLPALLRHFKVDFPPRLALYQAGERILRPMMMVLVPMVWFYLAKSANKCGKKLLLSAGALGFFLFVLPMTLPWNIQRQIYIGKVFEKLSGELSRTDTVCFVDGEHASFFRKYFKQKVYIYGKDKINIAPEQLKSAVAENLKAHNVAVVCTNRKQELEAPRFAGKQYVVGRYRLFYYYKNGVKK